MLHDTHQKGSFDFFLCGYKFETGELNINPLPHSQYQCAAVELSIVYDNCLNNELIVDTPTQS